MDCTVLYAQSFLSDHSTRLGRNGLDEVRKHQFFYTERWTWDNIQDVEAPFPPKLDNELDTRAFKSDEDGPSSSAPPVSAAFNEGFPRALPAFALNL